MAKLLTGFLVMIGHLPTEVIGAGNDGRSVPPIMSHRWNITSDRTFLVVLFSNNLSNEFAR